jgi:hypothetical protein
MHGPGQNVRLVQPLCPSRSLSCRVELLFQCGTTLGQKVVQSKRACRRPCAWGKIVVIDPLQLFQRIAVKFRQIDPLPHGRRETPRRVLLKRSDLCPPMPHRGTVRPPPSAVRTGPRPRSPRQRVPNRRHSPAPRARDGAAMPPVAPTRQECRVHTHHLAYRHTTPSRRGSPANPPAATCLSPDMMLPSAPTQGNTRNRRCPP